MDYQGTPVEITKDDFESAIEDNKMVVFDFWAPWCGPCRFFAPVFEKLAGENPDVVFAKINTEDQPELAGALGIRAIPTLMVFKEQIGVFNQAGALPEQALRSLLEEVKKLDMDEVRAAVAAEQS